MKDVTERPFAALLGLMGWPYPGHGMSFWKTLLLDAGWQPELGPQDPLQAFDAAWETKLSEAKGIFFDQLAQDMPILCRWAQSIDWLQGCGRGDVVGVMSLHTGVVASHTCIAWRDDYRDASGALWNWEWTLCTPDSAKPGRLREQRVDASGCLLNARGEPTSKVLVKPTLEPDGLDGVIERWQRTTAEALREVHPVRTALVVEET